MNYRTIKAICKKIASTNIAANSSNFAIRIDKPAPARVIIPALEVIQPGLLRLCIATRAKLSEKKLEIIRPKAADFYRPGRGVPSPGWWGKGIQIGQSSALIGSYIFF